MHSRGRSRVFVCISHSSLPLSRLASPGFVLLLSASFTWISVDVDRTTPAIWDDHPRGECAPALPPWNSSDTSAENQRCLITHKYKKLGEYEHHTSHSKHMKRGEYEYLTTTTRHFASHRYFHFPFSLLIPLAWTPCFKMSLFSLIPSGSAHFMVSVHCPPSALRIISSLSTHSPSSVWLLCPLPSTRRGRPPTPALGYFGTPPLSWPTPVSLEL